MSVKKAGKLSFVMIWGKIAYFTNRHFATISTILPVLLIKEILTWHECDIYDY